MKLANLQFQSNKALSIVQFCTGEINSFQYISLANALKNKLAEVKEVSDSGNVNNLNFVNHSEHFIFMSDGDVLSGAKQNRVLNTSVLVSPHSKLTIPVSCVEQGRWRYSKTNFSESDYSAPYRMRSDKAREVSENLRRDKSYQADQSKVWSNVSSYEASYNYKSPTSSLSDIYENKKIDIDDFIKRFKIVNDSNGLAIFIHNRLLNLEIFNRTDIYIEYFSKLIKSAAFETMYLKEKANTIKEAEVFYKINEFADNASETKFEIHEGVGAGIEKRFETNEMTGFELEYGKNMIHYVALNLHRDESASEGKYRW